MRQVRDGSEDAFRQLMERHQGPLLNFFTRMGAFNHREDLAQETFLRLWKYRTKYKPKAKFTTFLYTLARHAWLDFVRKQIRFQSFTEKYREEVPQFTDGGMEKLRNRLDMQNALNKLSEKHRETLVLAVNQGLSYGEIAQILNIPVGTVKSRIFNALSTIQRLYNEAKS